MPRYPLCKQITVYYDFLDTGLLQLYKLYDVFVIFHIVTDDNH